MVAVDNSWERLHRRIIEIRDSAFYLYDTWVWPELLERAQEDKTAGGCRIAVTARWLAVARRESLTGAPKRYRTLDKALLPELTADQAGVRDEQRYLLELHRKLRSAKVRAFADGVH